MLGTSCKWSRELAHVLHKYVTVLRYSLLGVIVSKKSGKATQHVDKRYRFKFVTPFLKRDKKNNAANRNNTPCKNYYIGCQNDGGKEKSHRLDYRLLK